MKADYVKTETESHH